MRLNSLLMDFVRLKSDCFEYILSVCVEEWTGGAISKHTIFTHSDIVSILALCDSGNINEFHFTSSLLRIYRWPEWCFFLTSLLCWTPTPSIQFLGENLQNIWLYTSISPVICRRNSGSFQHSLDGRYIIVVHSVQWQFRSSSFAPCVQTKCNLRGEFVCMS